MELKIKLDKACEELRSKLNSNYIYIKDVEANWDVVYLNDNYISRAFSVYNKEKDVVKFLSNY